MFIWRFVALVTIVIIALTFWAYAMVAIKAIAFITP
jgi:hypothetical protein